MPNSAILTLAEDCVPASVEAPELEIFLRGEAAAKATDWQQAMLARLFTKGELVSAIKEGMDHYHEEHQLDFSDSEKLRWEKIKREGYLPFVALEYLIIDDIKREVLLSFSTDANVNLQEHGAVIYLSRDGWRLDPDHMDEYLAEIEEAEAGQDSIDSGEEEAAGKGVIPSDANADAGVLYGNWSYDEAAHREWMKNEGDSDNESRMAVDFYAGRQFALSEKQILYWSKYVAGRKPEVWEVRGYRVRGDRVSIAFKRPDEDDVRVWNCVYEHDRLRIAGDNSIYKRVNV